MTSVRFPSFDEHAREQRERELERTPAERLQWLWQARLFALKLERAAANKDSSNSESTPRR